MKKNIAQRSKDKIFVMLFILFMIFPYTSFLFIGKYTDRTNYENHEFTKLNDVIEATYDNKAASIENYINDNLPYKNVITRLNTLLDIKVFHNLNSSEVVLGKGGWLFYKKDLCIEDYCHIVGVEEEEVDRMVNAIKELEKYCKSKDVEVYILVTPNKENIYGSSYLPKYYKVESRQSRAEKLVDYIVRNTDVKVAFPEQQLKAYADKGIQVYKKYDTHWNMLGGYIGSDILLELMDEDIVNLNKEMILENGYCTGDLANMISMSKYYNDDINFDVDGYDENEEYSIVEERIQQNLNYSQLKANRSKSNKTILCVGDSFLNMMEPYIGSYFANSYFLHRMNYEEGCMEKIQPDILVITATERSFPYIYYDIENICSLLK